MSATLLAFWMSPSNSGIPADTHSLITLSSSVLSFPFIASFNLARKLSGVFEPNNPNLDIFRKQTIFSSQQKMRKYYICKYSKIIDIFLINHICFPF